MSVRSTGYEEHQIDQLRSVGHLFTVSQGRCGIYRLEFADGEFYVGQTVNIVGRIADHRRRWPDLTSVQFARVPSAGLDELEQAHIKANVAKGLNLRNSMEVLVISHPAGRPDEIGGFINVGNSAMQMPSLRRKLFWARHRGASPRPAAYEAAGPDVTGIDFDDLDALDRLLNDARSPAKTAARELNLRLVRKGPTMQWRWHSFALADHLV